NGKNWIPAECDVSIRPGWFYHKEQDDSVKTPEQLFQLYLKSVGRGANLLLNVPPDMKGLINENDSAALVEFKKLRDESFERPVASTKFGKPSATYSIEINETTKINCVVLNEAVVSGQKIKSFTIYFKIKNKT